MYQNRYVVREALIRSVLLRCSQDIRHVVQVGANDGVFSDFYNGVQHIFKWSTTFVEPHPVLFKTLVKNYEGRGENLKFVNAALDVTEGTRTLYSDLVNFPGKSSFYKEEAHTESSIEVPTVTWNSVLEESTDLVITDCEGHDETLLRDLVENFRKPTLLIWENRNYSNARTFVNFLNEHGYRSLNPMAVNVCSFLQNNTWNLR